MELLTERISSNGMQFTSNPPGKLMVFLVEAKHAISRSGTIPNSEVRYWRVAFPSQPEAPVIAIILGAEMLWKVLKYD